MRRCLTPTFLDLRLGNFKGCIYQVNIDLLSYLFTPEETQTVDFK